MSCCNFENTKQNAQNNEFYWNENKCAGHKYITYHMYAHIDHIYASINTSSCPAKSQICPLLSTAKYANPKEKNVPCLFIYTKSLCSFPIINQRGKRISWFVYIVTRTHCHYKPGMVADTCLMVSLGSVTEWPIVLESSYISWSFPPWNIKHTVSGLSIDLLELFNNNTCTS